VATEAAWLNGNNLEKEEIKKKKEKNERRDLTLTGLLMEGLMSIDRGKRVGDTLNGAARRSAHNYFYG
jgi:hypothetical protein